MNVSEGSASSPPFARSLRGTGRQNRCPWCSPLYKKKKNSYSFIRTLWVYITHLRYRFLPETVTARHNGVHAQTIINHLRPPRRLYTGQILTAHHRAARLLWTRRHLYFTPSSSCIKRVHQAGWHNKNKKEAAGWYIEKNWKGDTYK